MIRRRREAGSITPIWLFLITTTLFLLILFVDREWVNYQVRKVRQTADFAAEAGAATAQITYHLQVDGQVGTPTTKQDCATCPPYTYWSYQPWSTTCSGTLEQLSGTGWFSRCGCLTASDQVQIECQRARELSPEIQFPAVAADLTMETFAANWVDRPNSRVTLTYFHPEPERDRRLVGLFVNIRITSLFGVNWWPETNYPVWGRSTLKIPPLRLSAN